ncbi:MAG: selenide, water dikinase SelD [Proteobacteria bacterium]|jgi:selenide,water dikinase|nr:selenide, water dikinase SelD [Pseudomonadota bacterium]
MQLTQPVPKGGCAAKVPALILREILAGVKFPPLIPGVSVDGALFDDAAIFDVTPEISLVQTLDFFTPILDDPHDFGAVAAANALSDVYAMGGRPKTCMAILAAPLATLEPAIIRDVMQGASDVITKSKSSLVGGHSIDDDTLKFGLSVTGLVNPKHIWKNDGARVGDVLILTKPLGTGTLCAGLKRGVYTQEVIQEAIDSMKRLNNAIDYLTDTQGIHAATDITGFGLAGHSVQMARASKVTLEFSFKSLPLFKKTMSSLEAGHLTKAHRSNDEYTRKALSCSLSTLERQVLFDPQTSGGLLLSVAKEASEQIVQELKAHFPGVAIVGEVRELKHHHVYVH